MDFIYEYQDATKKLSDEMATALVAEIPKKYTSLNDKRQTQIDDTKAIRKALNNKEKPKTADNWQSSFKIPDLFEIKQTLEAHLWENLWSNPENMFSVEGQDAQSEQFENEQKAMLVDSLSKMKVSPELDKAVDDLIDTGSRISSSTKSVLAAGAKKVYVAATHALLSKNATGVLNELPIEQIVVTHTIKHKRYPDRMVRISVDQLLARGIDYVYNDRSIHQIFDEQNRLK